MVRFLIVLITLSSLWSAPTLAQPSDPNAQAREHFADGNRALSRARRSRGVRQQRSFEQALEFYQATLAIVRSRNALFNAGLVLEQLGRDAEAFGYLREYMAIEGLDEDEQQEGQSRLDALRPRLALVHINTQPPGAQVFVDRLDLASQGTSPQTLALEPGTHTLYFRLDGYTDAQLEVTAILGQQTETAHTLAAERVLVRFDIIGSGELSVDGETIEEMQVHLLPGAHIATLVSPRHAPVERRFVVESGQPMVLELDAGAGERLPGTLTIHANIPVGVSIDGLNRTGDTQNTQHEVSVAAGAHDLSIWAHGRPTWQQHLTVEEGQVLSVEVELGEQGSRPLGILPHISLGLTVGTGLTFAVLAVMAKNESNAFEETCGGVVNPNCDSLADDVDSANLRADVVLGITGALAITTVVMYLLNGERGSESDGRVQVAASQDGAMVGVEGTF